MGGGETIFSNGQRHQRRDTDTKTGTATLCFSKRQGWRPRGAADLVVMPACAEQGGRTIFREKQGDVGHRQCDHRASSQRMTPGVLWGRSSAALPHRVGWVPLALAAQIKKYLTVGTHGRLLPTAVAVRCMGPHPSISAGRATLILRVVKVCYSGTPALRALVTI